MNAEVRRLEALSVLLAVARGTSLERNLDAARRRLPPDVEPGFLVELVRGALVWQARYDHVVRHFSRKRATPDPVVRAILHVSLHQLLAMPAVPAYAAIHQAGELCRAADRGHATGYVNGVLQSCQRLLATRDGDVEAALRPVFPDPATDPVAFLSAWHSHPSWLVEDWLGRFGSGGCEALLRHDNQPPPVCLHVLAPHDVDAAARALDEAAIAVGPGRLHGRALILQERPDRATLLRALATAPGLIVQDEGAQAALAWLVEAGVDAPVVDLCAAPGGKALHLASLLPPGGRVVAMDIQARRLRLVQETVARLGEERIVLVVGDGTAPPLASGRVPAVLVDGPCSGTGVIRHHPEGRWRLRPGTLARNAGRLTRLLLAAADLVAPGGRVYYATCSLQPAENEDVVAAAMAARGDLALEDQRAWLPQDTGTDGFFAARLRRTGEGS